MSEESERKLARLLGDVCDERSFLMFVQALVENRTEEIALEGDNPSGLFMARANRWQNETIEAVLDASAAWAIDMEFGRARADGKFDENNWNQFAHFLYAGKIYE